MRRPASIALAFLAAAMLGGCQKSLDAPTDRGVCWHLASLPGGGVKFNPLARNVADLEHCAAQLEMMRVEFLSLGGSQSSVTGAFQGQYLFVQPDGVFTAQTYTGFHYPFMVRTGDGRLAVPGAIPMTPQQDKAEEQN
jgi:hypothetical protein